MADYRLVLDKSFRSARPPRRAWLDRAALAALALAAAAASASLNVHERLHHWADEHEPHDPFLLLPVAVGLAVLTLAYLVGARRRLRREVAIRQEREDALTKALHEVEVLSGLLAMCASCKRIRDEDDRWEPVEAYLQRHVEISVSHGICPECANKLYPNYVGTVHGARCGESAQRMLDR